jgi:molybdopterin-guanine dinucleotide biosynthesis protein A
LSREAGAIVLAGGRSARMGTPKAMLDFAGTTLVERIVAELSKSYDEIVVAAAPEAHGLGESLPQSLRGVTIIYDKRAYEGPVGALARGLEAIEADRAFVCACDLPLLRAEVASAVVAMLSDYDAAIPVVAGKLQPLCAAYGRQCAPILRAMESRGERRLVDIAGHARVRRIGEDELRAIDPELASFLNVNTAADYARALEIARVRQGER